MNNDNVLLTAPYENISQAIAYISNQLDILAFNVETQKIDELSTSELSKYLNDIDTLISLFEDNLPSMICSFNNIRESFYSSMIKSSYNDNNRKEVNDYYSSSKTK